MENKGILVLRWVFWALAAAIMVFLFINSAKPAQQSSEISKAFTVQVFQTFVSGYEEMAPEEQTELVSSSQFVVRKSAHFTAYFALGSCIAAAMATHKLKISVRFITSLSATVLYAVSDEIHQLFVEGRACRLYDVALDSFGALVGVSAVLLIVLLITKLYRRKK